MNDKFPGSSLSPRPSHKWVQGKERRLRSNSAQQFFGTANATGGDFTGNRLKITKRPRPPHDGWHSGLSLVSTPRVFDALLLHAGSVDSGRPALLAPGP